VNRVFLDANVLFSAAISSGGVTRAIFELAEQYPSVLELVVSEYAITEALRNLQRKRSEAVSDLLSLIDGMRFTQEPPGVLIDRLRDLVSDSKDVPIVAGAVWAEADLLITGNTRHFGQLYGSHVGGCLILPPRAALDLLLSEIQGG
jgi:predicted nucleic acid-binding protein